MMRQVFVADTDDEALTVTRVRHSQTCNHSILKLWHDHDDHSVDALFGLGDGHAATDRHLWLAGKCARAIEPGSGSERLQLRHLRVRMGQLAAQGDTEITAAVRAGGHAGLFGAGRC